MSLSTTQYGYIVDPMVPFTDEKGKTIKNGFIRVFMAGTSTPVLTYRNYDGATNQEKIELDNSGRVKHNVIGSKGSLYKVVVYNILHSQENPLLTVDKIAVLGASINATGATIVTGLDSVTVQEENFLKATVEGTGVELALDPTEVTSEVSTISDAATAAPDYVVPLLDKTGEGDSKKISLANIFKFALDWISRLSTTITSFASGDFFAVSNTTDGPRKMSKDSLLELTAQNALAGNAAEEFKANKDYKQFQYVIEGGKLRLFKVDHSAGNFNSSECWTLPDNSKYIPPQKFATSTGTISYTASDFSLNSYENRLETKYTSKPPLFAGKGDVITIKPASGLTITLLQATSFKPFIFSTLKTVANGTDTYTFARDMYIVLLVAKTDSSTISLSDFGNTAISVKQAIVPQQMSEYTNINKQVDSVIQSRMPVSIVDGIYSVSERKRLVDIMSLASKDGIIVFAQHDVIQNGTELRTRFFDVQKGDRVVFDGSGNSSLAKLYKYSSGTYTALSSYEGTLDYEAQEDFTAMVDIKITGQTYSYTNYLYGSLSLARYVSSKTLDKMKQDIANASGFSVSYPYAKVKDGKLIACDPIVQTSRADYLAVDMGGTVSYIGCKWYWPTTHGTRGVVCIASMPDTWSKKISGTNGITGKALHITCTMTNLRVDFLGGDWGEYYYANLINQVLDLSTDPTVEHKLSVTISGESVTVKVDGSTYTGTNASDKSMTDVVGKYAFVEHYNSSSSEQDMPEYTAFKVASANGTMYDSFDRENGMCTMSPQGYPYINVGTATQTFPNW